MKALVSAVVLLCAPFGAMSAHSQTVIDRITRSRAAEAVVWGMPAVNFELMFAAMRKAGGKANQIVYWSRPLDWKNQTLTPNPSTVYFMHFIDTKDGPMVLEIPAASGGSITGTVTDAWQNALEDIGPAGTDKGRGAKYLILPPGYARPVPKGYVVLRAATYMTGPLLRSNITGGTPDDFAKALAYGKRIKLYPFARAANPPATVFIDAVDTVYDSTIRYDLSFFETLDRFIQREPWLTRDKAMIDPLKSVGIVRGKSPDFGGARRDALEQGARDAKAYLDIRYEGLFTPYYPGGHWALPVAPDVITGLANDFGTADVYPVDDRGTLYSFAFSAIKHLGSGQFYLVAIKDGTGAPLRGADTYRLTIPPNAPVDLYWSSTAYDRETHALIRNVPRASRGSNIQDVQKNADGSFDIYFGPKAPAGKDANWVPTDPQRDFEVMTRFYGPRKPLHDKSWRLPDIEKVTMQ